MTTPVYLEASPRVAFAVSLDWPGWARAGRTVDDALNELDRYRSRYGDVVSRRFRPGPVDVVGTIEGNASTQFGVPSVVGLWDDVELSRAERRHHLEILNDVWAYFDATVDASPSQLTKGPRGGGRDRDAIADHVREGERSYCSKVGARVPIRTPWREQRATLIEALERPAVGKEWPRRYALRRIAWHIVDHAWEIEDKSV